MTHASAALTMDRADNHCQHRTRDPALVARCLTAFEAAWRAAIPHSPYTPC
jgi:hypothetical protein